MAAQLFNAMIITVGGFPVGFYQERIRLQAYVVTPGTFCNSAIASSFRPRACSNVPSQKYPSGTSGLSLRA